MANKRSDTDDDVHGVAFSVPKLQLPYSISKYALEYSLLLLTKTFNTKNRLFDDQVANGKQNCKNILNECPNGAKSQNLVHRSIR